MAEEREMIKVDYVMPGPAVQRFHNSNAFVRGIRGVIGSGKSSACAFELLLRAQQQEPHNGIRKTKWGIIRNTTPELVSTTLPDFTYWLPELETAGYSHRVIRQPPMHSKLVMALQDKTVVEAEFLFRALDREDDVAKLKSLSLTGAWINEASEIEKAIFDMAIGRVDRYPHPRDGGPSWAGIIMDTNPPDTDSWWYKAAEVEKPEGWEFFDQPPAVLKLPSKKKDDPPVYVPNKGQDPRYPCAENIHNLRSGYEYYMRQVPGKSIEWIKVFLQGEYGVIAYGKPVFEDIYNDAVHYADEELEVYGGLPVLIGIDPGLSGAAVFGQITPRGQLRILDEVIGEGRMGMKQFIQTELKPMMLNRYAGMKHIMLCDPTGINMRSQADSDAATAYKMLTNEGFHAELAKTNNQQVRRDAVVGYLTRMMEGAPRFLLSSRCQKIREGFLGKYQYRKRRTSTGISYAEEPEKNHPFSDIHDCIAEGSFVTMGDYSEKRIESVLVGDMVMTPSGSKRVTNAWLVDASASVVEAHLSSGLTLIATPDHRVMTDSGWKPLDAVCERDILYSIKKGGNLCEEIGKVRYAYNAVRHFLFQGGRSVKEKVNTVVGSAIMSLCGKQREYCTTTCGSAKILGLGITGINEVMERQYPYIDIYGNPLMDLSQTGIVSTTLTRIWNTTIYRILNVWNFLNTPICISTIVEEQIQKACRSEFGQHSWQQKNGIGQPREENGIGVMPKAFGPISKKNRGYVPFAASRMSDRRDTQKSCFVAQDAKERQEGSQELMMSRENVASVTESSKSIDTPARKPVEIRLVAKCSGLSPRKVYDLTVESDHCFYANGVLVHNCIQYISCHGETGGSANGQMPMRSSGRREIVKGSSLGWT